MPAEQKSAMTTKKRTRLVAHQGLIRPPAYPFSPQEILHRIRSSLQQQTETKMTYQQIGRLTGQETNTAHYWWSQSVHAHLLALMCLLEQLTPARRQEVIGSCCRVLPSLVHPRLAHDLENLRVLFEVLRPKAGVTVVTGGTDLQRTFIFTSLARAFPVVGPRHRAVAGLDLHQPLDFVPVPGLIYSEPTNDPTQLRVLVERAWPMVKESRAPVICLNRVWSAAPARRPEILRWSWRRHILMAENGSISTRELRAARRGDVRVIQVSGAKEPVGAIRLTLC